MFFFSAGVCGGYECAAGRGAGTRRTKTTYPVYPKIQTSVLSASTETRTGQAAEAVWLSAGHFTSFVGRCLVESRIGLKWIPDAPQEKMVVMQMSRECFCGRGVVGLCDQLEHAASFLIHVRCCFGRRPPCIHRLDMCKFATMFNSKNALPPTNGLIADGSWKILEDDGYLLDSGCRMQSLEASC